MGAPPPFGGSVTSPTQNDAPVRNTGEYVRDSRFVCSDGHRPGRQRLRRPVAGQLAAAVRGGSCRRAALDSLTDRARRGGSGALSLAIRSSEAESPLEGQVCGVSTPRTALMARGSRATSVCESGQVRKEAALSDHRRAKREFPVPEPPSGVAPVGYSTRSGARSTPSARRPRRVAAGPSLLLLRV